MALKFLLMTFLRAGHLLVWVEVDQQEGQLVIPGTTPGLKRTKKTEDLPITSQMEAS